MIRRTQRLLFLLAILPALWPLDIARGQEPEAVPVEQAIADCHALVTRRSWSEAVDAYQALFRDHPGDPAVIDRIRVIEDDLKLALFMREFEQREDDLLFGPELLKFSKTSLAITLLSKDHPSGPNWVELKGEWVLNLRFSNRLTIEVETETHDLEKPFLVYFCFDAEDRSGYVVAPGASWTGMFNGRMQPVGIGRCVLRIDSGRAVTIETSTEVGPSPGTYKVIRDSASIRLYQGRKMVLKAKDKKYESGMLGFAGVYPREAKISGKLDRDAYQRMSGQLRDRMFREWEKEAWTAKDHLPAWALGAAVVIDAPTLTTLPADARGLDPIVTGRIIDGALNGDGQAIDALRRLAALQTGNTRAWIRAVIAMGTDRMTVALEELDRLLADAPDFAPAYALRGMIRLGLRQVDAARADFAAAVERESTLSLAWLGQVLLAIYDGDLAAASGVIDRAREAGAQSSELKAFDDRLHQVRRGPNWPRRFDLSTAHFSIASNHSKELCREVGELLESQISSLREQFPGVERSERKTRVYVFSSRDGFLGYASDRLQDLSQAAGAYDPRMREIVLFVPRKREGFVHTVRHEGVHCFLHEFLDDAPMWFNEGLAEYFGSGRLLHGALYEPGALHERALETLAKRSGRTMALEALLGLTRKEFMQDAALSYAQSWALVHLLSKTRDPVLRNLLLAYFRCLRDGMPRDEAFAEVFERYLPKLSEAYEAHLEDALQSAR